MSCLCLYVEDVTFFCELMQKCRVWIHENLLGKGSGFQNVPFANILCFLNWVALTWVICNVPVERDCMKQEKYTPVTVWSFVSTLHLTLTLKTTMYKDHLYQQSVGSWTYDTAIILERRSLPPFTGFHCHYWRFFHQKKKKNLGNFNQYKYSAKAFLKPKRSGTNNALLFLPPTQPALLAVPAGLVWYLMSHKSVWLMLFQTVA